MLDHRMRLHVQSCPNSKVAHFLQMPQISLMVTNGVADPTLFRAVIGRVATAAWMSTARRMVRLVSFPERKLS